MQLFEEYLNSISPNPILLDGPIGTELSRRGYELHPILWSAPAAMQCPELLKDIYQNYIRSGSQILTANTFRTSAYILGKANINPVFAQDWTKESIQLVQRIITQYQRESGVDPVEYPIFTLGSIGPLEDCYRPELVPQEDVLIDEHSRMIKLLVDEHVDLVMAETIGTHREAQAIAYAFKANKVQFGAMSFILGATGRELLSGEPLGAIVEKVVSMGVRAILLNCSYYDQIEEALRLIRGLLKSLSVHDVVLGAYPNISKPIFDGNTFTGHWENEDCLTRLDPDQERKAIHSFVQNTSRWVRDYQIQIIGGCCGMNPSFISALNQELNG